MDRKTILTFIAVYALVAGIGYFSQRDPVDQSPISEESASYQIEVRSLKHDSGTTGVARGESRNSSDARSNTSSLQ